MISFQEGLEHMASAVAQAYNGGLGAEPPAGSRGSQGAEPLVGDQGAKPPEAESFLLRRPKEVANFAHFWEKSN